MRNVLVMQPVFRIEADGEEAIPYPTLGDATREAPTHSEARIATSAKGVTLAEATPDGWVLTNAGRDVVAVHGWRCAS